ncbi:MAG: hypothetical protein JKY42_07875 [Flavobacteriales bacterium]|nr:hypothetical protein [Flavobacteriales bacterium]
MLARLKNIIVIIVISVLPLSLLAAPSPPDGGGPDTCFPNPCIPIDQGDFIIIGIGVLFAVFFLFQKKEEIIK